MPCPDRLEPCHSGARSAAAQRGQRRWRGGCGGTWGQDLQIRRGACAAEPFKMQAAARAPADAGGWPWIWGLLWGFRGLLYFSLRKAWAFKSLPSRSPQGSRCWWVFSLWRGVAVGLQRVAHVRPGPSQALQSSLRPGGMFWCLVLD